MATPTPEQAAANWAMRLTASTDRMKAGVESVTVAPGAAAARAKQTWLNNVTAAADKFARNVGAVPLSVWQEAYVTKGLPRIATGAQTGQTKVAAFMGQFLPFITSAVKALPPRGTIDQNIARATSLMKTAHGFQYNRPTS